MIENKFIQDKQTLQDRSLMQQPLGCSSTLTSKTGQISNAKNLNLYT